MENTTNLNLPLLIPNQFQKEITHNEALIILDTIVQNGIIDKDLVVPPENANSNDLYIVGDNSTGAWQNKDGQLAFYDNGWRFIKPREGFIFWVNDEEKIYVYKENSWSEISNQIEPGGNSEINNLSDLSDVSIESISQYDVLQYNGLKFINTKEIQNINLLGINTTADEFNKFSVKSDYVLFDKLNNSSQIKVNKASETDTASHLFQTNYGGRAEFGTIGSDDFTLKISGDGGEWKQVFVVDKDTGNIDFKNDITNNGKNFMPYPQNFEGKGEVLQIHSGKSEELFLPSEGTWFVIESHSIDSTTSISYNFDTDDIPFLNNQYIFAGNSKIRNGRTAHIQQASIIRVQ